LQHEADMQAMDDWYDDEMNRDAYNERIVSMYLNLIMQPIPNFNFVNRREVEFTLEALNRLAQSGDVDPIEQEDFYNFLDAFQLFALQI
jgi:hypothetical protein